MQASQITPTLVVVIASLAGVALGVLGTIAAGWIRQTHRARIERAQKRADCYARLMFHAGELIAPTDPSGSSHLEDLRGFFRAYCEAEIFSSGPVRDAAESWMLEMPVWIAASPAERDDAFPRVRALKESLHRAVRAELGLD